MGYAAVISLEDLREAKSRVEFRQKIHERFDRWLDRMEEEMKEPKPTLAQLAEVVFHLRQELTQSVTEGLLESRYAAEKEQETILCPGCGQPLHARGEVERTVETMVGAIRLSRPYFYCIPCQRGIYPLDEALELTERRKQPDVQKAAAKLTKEVPYETACELFEELTGLTLSAHTAHEVTNEAAEGLSALEVSPSREEVKARTAAVADGKKWRPILVLAIDGADVPTRPEPARGRRRGRKRGGAKRARWKGQWREAKGFRFYLVDEDRILHLISWHQIQDEEELFESLKQVKEAGLIPEEQVRLCVLADGARWIWKRIKGLFPTAKEVLDYYHCSEHIHWVAQAPYKNQPHKALEWVEATMARLFCNEITGVLWGLQRMKPHDEEAATEIEKGLIYLENNKERLDYGSLRKGGYPIGSGGIESANKFICHVRLKRSGAWWYVANGNKMLALRCAKYNGTFDRIFDRYSYQQKTKGEVRKR
jgi:Uncharacterised protein family (UPF0236)